MKTAISFKLALAGAASFLVLAAASQSLAATQGTLGATSTGSIGLSVTKTMQAEISSLTDWTLAAWSITDAAPAMTENVCVYSTRPTGGYTIKATGNGTANAFTISNGTSTIPYSVSWNDGGVGNLTGAGVALTAGTTSAKMINAATDSNTCNGAKPGPTAALSLGITSAAMVAATDGTYTGTLTLLVTPD